MKHVEWLKMFIIALISLWLALEGSFERATFLLVFTLFIELVWKKEGE